MGHRIFVYIVFIREISKFCFFFLNFVSSTEYSPIFNFKKKVSIVALKIIFNAKTVCSIGYYCKLMYIVKSMLIDFGLVSSTQIRPILKLLQRSQYWLSNLTGSLFNAMSPVIQLRTQIRI